MILRLFPLLRPDRLLLAALALLATPVAMQAHDIPPRVTAFVYVKPEGRVMHIVMRVPLESMRDINFPQRGTGFLDVERTTPLLDDAVRLWLTTHLSFYENGAALPVPSVVNARLSVPSDRSFTAYETALAHIAGDPPLTNSVEMPWQQAMLDVSLTVPIASDQSHFAFEPTLAQLGLRTTTVLHFLPAGRSERAFEFDGNPGLIVLDPHWYQAALRFVRLGFEHILSGLDHLLFVLCLVIPLRRIRPLIGVITAFTAAHSITLIASAFGFAPSALWFPPLIETLIAVSIVYMAFENMVARNSTFSHRWMLAFGFGLVHGFAFSFALRESMQFAGSHLLAALLSFNVGVELGQVLVVALAVPVLALLFSRVVRERAGVILLSAIVAHTAWHWMLDRGAVLGQYRFQLPEPDIALAIGATRFLMLALVVGAVAWGLSKGIGRLTAGGADSSLRRSRSSGQAGRSALRSE